jgi:transcriptional antiterminator RfaH
MSDAEEDAPASALNEARWYCLRSQPKREHIAAAFLREQCGVEVFCPRISQFKKTRSGKRRYIEALFPGYLFARFALGRQYRQVVHCRGVSRLVSRGRTQIPVADAIIEDLRKDLPEDAVLEAPDPSLDPGAPVEFVAGSLSGLSGKVVARLPAGDRVKVLLDFLGREVTVAVSPGDIMLSGRE